MGMEVIWIRLFTTYIGPVVYSFARILAAYLAATFVGSRVYRVWSRHNEHENPLVWVSLAFFGLLSLLAADGRIALSGNLRVLLGVAPFAGVIGFLTPMLVDRWSGGDPDRAGRAYAVNVAGLHPRTAAGRVLPVALVRRARIHVAVRSAMVCHGDSCWRCGNRGGCSKSPWPAASLWLRWPCFSSLRTMRSIIRNAW